MRTSEKNPVHLLVNEHDPSIIHVYYHSLLFYQMNKERIRKHVFNSTKYKKVRAIIHLLEHGTSVIGFNNKYPYIGGVTE